MEEKGYNYLIFLLLYLDPYGVFVLFMDIKDISGSFASSFLLYQQSSIMIWTPTGVFVLFMDIKDISGSSAS
jgi:hypothetical protein